VTAAMKNIKRKSSELLTQNNLPGLAFTFKDALKGESICLN
jgi:hypothetical protein